MNSHGAMRTFAELSQTARVHPWRATDLGAAHLVVDATRIVWTGADLEGYESLHQFAHLWIHRDYDHDAWHVLEVDVPIEVGTDFVMMPGRVGNTLESFTRQEERVEAPARLAQLKALMPELVASARDPVDRWIAALVARRIENPDFNTVYVWKDQRFYIQDLAPSRAELLAWRALPPSEWQETNDEARTRQVAQDLVQERIERVAAAKAAAPAYKERLDVARVMRESRTDALGRMSADELAIKLEDLYYVDHARFRTNQELIDLLHVLAQHG